ncbi:MAG: NnrS family protein [Polyangiaceae bacterium]
MLVLPSVAPAVQPERRALPLVGETSSARPRLAVSAKGFRVFFALAACYAVLIVPLWLAILGGVASPSNYLDPLSWHAHEMVFGFTVAVIAGFLLTAVGNWTQRETLIGAPLLALAGLWVLGRVAMILASQLPRGVAAAADLAFLPMLIVALARPLVATRSHRHFVILGVLSGLFAANVAVHLDALGLVAAGTARRASSVAVDFVALVILIIAGRVFPMFTRGATGVDTIRSHRLLDVMTVVGMAALVIVDAVAAEPPTPSIVAGVVGLLAVARAIHWGAQHSLRQPLLWILHAGYAWLALGLLLRGAGSFAPVLTGSMATHAITAGAIGSLTLGMMARVSLGHTGRPLVAPPAMRWAFAAITLGAVARVLAPVVAPGAYLTALIIAGALWSMAMLAFLVVYTPMLVAPRIDGKAG